MYPTPTSAEIRLHKKGTKPFYYSALIIYTEFCHYRMLQEAFLIEGRLINISKKQTDLACQ